jgi:hypothetical protein
MVVIEFPGHFRDLAGMRADGMAFSSPSDTAVKMLDALIHQVVYHFDNPTLGGQDGTIQVETHSSLPSNKQPRRCLRRTQSSQWVISSPWVWAVSAPTLRMIAHPGDS